MIITEKFFCADNSARTALLSLSFIINTYINIQAIEVVPSKTSGVNRLGTNLGIVVINSEFLLCRCLNKNYLLFIINISVTDKLLQCSNISKDLFTTVGLKLPAAWILGWLLLEQKGRVVRISSLQFILSICVSTSFSLSLFIIIAAPFIAERCGG